MPEWRVKLFRGSYYAVRSHAGRTERFALRTKDLAEAKRKLVDELSVPIGDTVSDLVEAYLAEKDQTAIRAQGLRDAWKNSRPHFGHLRPDQITRLVCRDYTASRKRLGRKPATIRKEIEVVRAGLNYHKKAGSAVFELPPQPKPKERFLSRDEARRLSRAARGFPHIRGFIVLSLATGARGSALLDLTWDRVDFARGRIHLPLTEEDVRQKNRAVVPMNRRARRYLRVMRAAATCDHVIEWGGHRVLSVKKGFRSAAHKAGLTDVTPHTLRHTAASWMAIKGIRMFEISKYLGHSDARFTERRYAHLSPDHLRDAADALEW